MVTAAAEADADDLVRNSWSARGLHIRGADAGADADADADDLVRNSWSAWVVGSSATSGPDREKVYGGRCIGWLRDKSRVSGRMGILP